MLDKPLTPNENRRTFDAVLVRALTDGQRCSSCFGLHPDVLDAIDAVAEVLINAAESINDLRVPPGDRLEKLAGDRAGQYSVRVNDQWRICFTWSASGAGNVELVDYH